MKKLVLGEIIATRRLFLEGTESSDSGIVVMLGKPLPFDDRSSFYCPYKIEGIGSEKVKFAAGVDEVQALQLAMQMIGTDLYELINPGVNNRLRWEGDEHGELGFPRPHL